jgi:predicted Rossmann fold flavoprotein
MTFDKIIIGGGACGIMSAIISAKQDLKVLIIEKLPKIAQKLKASGGGRCNLTNKLPTQTFIDKFGKNGRFIRDSLQKFDSNKLLNFFKEIGVETHSLDGFRVFPTSHNSSTIIEALIKELNRLNIQIITSTKVEKILVSDKKVIGVQTTKGEFKSEKIVLATGGAGYPMLGTEGDGFKLSEEIGHKITDIFPAMMPLKVKEKWVNNCKSDTIGKAIIKVNLKKYKNLKAEGDLIFTKDGIRGPVVLDFAREITPLLSKFDEVPIVINLVKGKNQEELKELLKDNFIENCKKLLAKSILNEIFILSGLDNNFLEKTTKIEIKQKIKNRIIELMTNMPLTITGSDGFKMAMITRGGVSLKEINPKTMESKIVKGLYFCGEVVDIDGPCGGYNLQWAFSSGYVAGKS